MVGLPFFLSDHMHAHANIHWKKSCEKNLVTCFVCIKSACDWHFFSITKAISWHNQFAVPRIELLQDKFVPSAHGNFNDKRVSIVCYVDTRFCLWRLTNPQTDSFIKTDRQLADRMSGLVYPISYRQSVFTQSSSLIRVRAIHLTSWADVSTLFFLAILRKLFTKPQTSLSNHFFGLFNNSELSNIRC